MYAQTIMQHFTEYPAVNPRDIDPGMLLTTHSEVVMTVRSACSSMRFLRRGVMTRHVENMLEKNCRIASFAMVFLQAIIHLLVTIQEHKLVIQDLKVEMQIDQQELEAMFENQKIPLPGELLKVYQKFDWLLNGLETGLLDEGRAPSGCLNFICRTHPRTLPPTDEEFMQAIKISRMGPPALRFAVEKTANSMHGDLRRRLRRLVAKMDCGEPVNDSDSVLSASASSES
ncbi:hypothetical protein OE88DRAFT_1330189 [Heliocybe sulcata]|uniref:Uncharacterized protein n=1 Tax=Heliocybe sulcata TaxID=5364 RepID=A0A5C3N6U8_9AGAM|nr:hypothetical protein OE88DRAFT_1330189 [Heliocybe sulcata]